MTMNEFEQTLCQAKSGDREAINAMVQLYRPLLIGSATINGLFDEEFYQECICTLIECLNIFEI